MNFELEEVIGFLDLGNAGKNSIKDTLAEMAEDINYEYNYNESTLDGEIKAGSFKIIENNIKTGKYGFSTILRVGKISWGKLFFNFETDLTAKDIREDNEELATRKYKFRLVSIIPKNMDVTDLDFTTEHVFDEDESTLRFEVKEVEHLVEDLTWRPLLYVFLETIGYGR